MKKTFIILGIGIFSICNAQTNTFPSSGNVGIGTNSPKAKLEVVGSTMLDGHVAIKGPFLEFRGSDIQLGVDDGRSVGSKPHQRALVHENNDVLVINFNGDFEGGTVISGDKTIVEGNVGIGTNSPKAKLEVVGSTMLDGHVAIKGPFLEFRGSDIQLGVDDGRSVGSKPHQRALVHENNDVLVINFNGDFEGGTVISGDKTIVEGNVGIGTNKPDEKLTVNGTVHAKEVKVDLQIPADYVFQKYYTGNSSLKENYQLPTLEEVEQFTKENHHLPNIPSAKEIQGKGLQLGEMTNLLLQKIEELTLYTIEQKKLIESQKELIENQEERLQKLESQVQY